MLELRPNCEWCDKNLPPDTDEAMICTYECTYCRNCVEKILHNVCPTCGGNFAPRPFRPKLSYRDGKTLGLENHPASKAMVHSPWSAEQVAELTEQLRDVPPNRR